MRRALRLVPVVLLLGGAVVPLACGGESETSSSISRKSSDERSTPEATDDESDSSTTQKRTTTTRKATTSVPAAKRPHLSIPKLPGIVSTTAPGVTIPPSTHTVTELTGFTSPSGNIGCYIDPSYLRCDIGERSWDPPPMPASCDLEYGQGISVSPGEPAAFVCAGDTALGGGSALPYGESIGAGVLRCASAESGMSCTDVSTGHGFTLAIEGYMLF